MSHHYITLGPKFIGAIQALMTLIIIILLVFVYSMLPIIESFVFPVIEPGSFKIQRVGTDKITGLTIVDIHFNKLRDCALEFDRMSWYRASETGRQRIYFEPPKIPGDISRPTGKNFAPGWKVNYLEITNYMKQQEIVLYHKCHSLWTLKTNIIISSYTDRK